MAPTWSKHGCDMVPYSTHSIGTSLMPICFSFKTFKLPASLEVGRAMLNLALSWSKYDLCMIPQTSDSVDWT